MLSVLAQLDSFSVAKQLTDYSVFRGARFRSHSLTPIQHHHHSLAVLAERYTRHIHQASSRDAFPV